MAKNKTVETKESVSAFLSKIKDEKRRKDCSTIIDLISKSTGFEAKMWGSAIVGFGSYHYKYDSGREGDSMLVGLASRANAIVLYLSGEFDKREEMLSKLGKHKLGGGCVYIQKLEDVNSAVLVKMVKATIAHRKKLYKA
jgi:hypothetical protein